MPSISTMVYPSPAYVRVETNWADVGQAEAVAVYRVDCVTGERVPLRPYVCFDGDFMDTSCGQGVWWDTEAPLDRCFYYCTQAIDAAGNIATTASDPLLLDSFTRNVASQWSPPTNDTGQSYLIVQGTAADFSVNGTLGRMQSTAIGQRHTIISTPIGVNMLAEGTIYPTVIATGGIFDQGLAVQYIQSPDTGYEALVRFNPGGQLDARINRVNSGSATVLNTTTNFATQTSSGLGMRIKFLTWGNQVKMKAWDVTTPEPANWLIEIIDPAPLTQVGGVGGVIRIQAGNTNVPFTASWDNLLVTDPCDSLQVIEVCSQDVVVPSSGDFRLGDPVRPCNDVELILNGGADPDCVPTQGIFFASMDDETDTDNSVSFLPVNAKYPISVSRLRGSRASTLNTVTRTFADRDALRTLRDPGSVLFLRSPAQYGVDDRYMALGNVTERRALSDHRIQPRSVEMPHVIVARPSGPTTGVCGARVDDLCDIYRTWDALAASGLSWADLLRGKASNKTPIPDTVERNWTDVNTTYANWTAANAGNTDWDDLRDGA